MEEGIHTSNVIEFYYWHDSLSVREKERDHRVAMPFCSSMSNGETQIAEAAYGCP